MFFLFLVLARVYPLLSPVWNSKETFQVDLSRNLARQNLNIFKGQLSFIPEHVKNALDLSPSYPWTEDFPLFNVMAAALMKLFNKDSLYVGRGLSFFFFLLASLLLYQFTRKEYGGTEALWCLVLWALAPILFVFSIQFMADMAMICSFIAALCFIQKYAELQNNKSFYLALLWAIFIPSFRYYGAFLFFPLLGYWFEKKQKLSFRFLILFVVPAIIPTLWLYYSLKLQNNPITLHQTHENWHWGYWKYYLLDSTFYYQIMFDRFFRYSLTYVSFIFFVIGLIKLRKNLFIWGYIICVLLSCGIFNIGHHIHEHYQMKFVPLLVLLAGVGLIYSLKLIKNKNFNFLLQICILFVSFILSTSQGYKLMRFDSSGKKLGQELKAFIQPQEKVLAIQDVPDPGVFIYSNTQGWILNSSFLQARNTIRSDIGTVVVRTQSKPLDLDVIKAQGFEKIWSFEGNLGLHTKCGVWNFFFGECKRNSTYLYIFSKRKV